MALFQGIAMLLNQFLLFWCIHLYLSIHCSTFLSGVEIQCIGHFRLLFGLLSVDSCKPIQCGALHMISSVTQNQECVNDIAASDVLVPLLLTLYSLPDAQVTTLEILYALMHTTKIVKDALAKGEHIHWLLCKKFSKICVKRRFLKGKTSCEGNLTIRFTFYLLCILIPSNYLIIGEL